jgi:hypothetical protein
MEKMQKMTRSWQKQTSLMANDNPLTFQKLRLIIIDPFSVLPRNKPSHFACSASGGFAFASLVWQTP